MAYLVGGGWGWWSRSLTSWCRDQTSNNLLAVVVAWGIWFNNTMSSREWMRFRSGHVTFMVVKFLILGGYAVRTLCLLFRVHVPPSREKVLCVSPWMEPTPTLTLTITLTLTNTTYWSECSLMTSLAGVKWLEKHNNDV